KVEQSQLGVEVIAQRIRRDLLRKKSLVIVVAAARGLPPVPVAARKNIGRFARSSLWTVASFLSRRRCHHHGGDEVGWRRRGFLLIRLFEQRVFLQEAFDFGVELERGELQQPYRLLQLRSQREVLTELELERRLHGPAAPSDR